MVAFMPIKIPFLMNGHAVNASKAEIVIIMLALYAGYCSFTYGIYLFRKVLKLFSVRKIFDSNVVIYFEKIGKAFIVSSILWATVPFFYKLYAESKLELGFATDGFGSALFSASLGLFFMVLSEVFLMAKNIKEENDLTV
jgi:hypothetical protein